jgi:serine/threonine protein kinase
MPPEVLLEGIISKAGDVYAYGVCFWEMICQKRAWMGLSTPQVIFAVSCRGERLKLPSTKGENGVPKEVVAIVEKCMAVDASKRPSFEELCTELDALTESKASSERSEQERSEQERSEQAVK